MGIDYDGGMLVGCSADEIDFPDPDIDGWCQENNLSVFSPWFDADIKNCFVGFKVDDVPVKNVDEFWMAAINEKAQKFKLITGCEASLMGKQHIW